MCEHNVSEKRQQLHSQPVTAIIGYATGISPRENTRIMYTDIT